MPIGTEGDIVDYDAIYMIVDFGGPYGATHCWYSEVTQDPRDLPM